MKFTNRKHQWRPPQGTTASVVITGDICPMKAEPTILAGNAKKIFAEIIPFMDSADLRIAQWECVVGEFNTPISKRGPNLQVPEGCTDILKSIHADVALLANNHVGDFGPDATMATISTLNRLGYKTVGAGKNLDDANKPLELTANGIRVTLLNFAEHEFGTATETAAGVAALDTLENIETIRKAKATGAVVIVALHGGHEYNPYPSPRMVTLFRKYTEAGADILWNCHTHCPEPVEVYNGKPIVYSPGNLFFPPVLDDMPKTWSTGYLTKFHFDAQGAYAIELLPYTQNLEAVKPLSPEGEKQFFEYMAKLQEPLDDKKELVRKFEIWCGLGGMDYLHCYEEYRKMPAWPPNWDDKTVVDLFLFFRNMYTCESHNDLLLHSLRLIEEYRYSEVLKHADEIKSLWNVPWL